ncbi:Myelin basic protein [Bagarius yarrelli]|uniref:Myelin basic protein n=1 Tax=Bagarius yarrelli TaxID=175774 RepID=A0A556U6C1_BAGYA|nr:Myelin basic protein [Bagarius yarrelli]
MQHIRATSRTKTKNTTGVLAESALEKNHQPNNANDHQTMSEPASRTTADSDSPDEVFGMIDSDVNQNKNRSNKSESMSGSARNAPPSAGQSNQGAGFWPRPHLVRLFSRDAPGREDNTFKERPSESDELHTIEEAGGATSENAE